MVTQMATVMAYETGETIGTEEVSVELLRASRDALGDTGAVLARRDDAGVWHIATTGDDPAAVTVYFEADDLEGLED